MEQATSPAGSAQMTVGDLPPDLPLLLLEFDRSGACRSASPFWQRFAGMAEAELQGDGWLACIAATHREPALEAVQRACRERRVFHEEWNVEPQDGRVIKVLATGAPRSNDHAPESLLVALQVQSHGQDTGSDGPDPQRAERWFQTVIESAPDAFLIVDGQGQVVLANRQAERLFGYPREELVGREVELLIPGRFRLSHVQLRKQYMGSPKYRAMSSGLDLFAYTKDGREIPVDVSLSPIEGPSGMVVACAVRDLTERLEATRLLKQRQEELAHVSRIVTAGEMASGLAHELNQPLYSIANYARGWLNRLDVGDLSAESMRKVAEEILADSLRAGEIIRRLRRMVQRHEPSRSPIEPHRLVKSTAELFQGEAKKYGVAVGRDVPDDLPLVMADEIEIQQVLLNLFINGARAMRDVPADQRRLQVIVRSEDDQHVRFDVRDCGHGIPGEDIDHIFDAFFTTSSSGMGMGLAISRYIVESHSGRIWATNHAAGGATISFTLPTTKTHGS